MRRIGAVVLGLVLLAGCTAACGSDDDEEGTAAGTTVDAGEVATGPVTVKGSEYAFEAPAKIEGGKVQLTIDNTGKEEHQAIAVKLAPGKSVTDLTAFFANPAAAGG